MDTEPGDLQFLSSVGIVGKAFKILRSCAKLLAAATLTLILPLCFASFGSQLIVSEYLLIKISWDAKFYQEEVGSPASERIMREFSWERTELVVFLVSYLVFCLAFSLLSTSAVVYIVASLYTGKEISYARVMSIVPRVWKRLVVTFLWFLIIEIAFWTAFTPVFFLFILILMKLYSGVILFVLLLIIVVFICGSVYISMVWHLACVISVLEDKYGLGAMRKSKDLIKGKQFTALELYILYIVFGGIIEGYFRSDVLHGDLHGVGSAGRGAYGVVLVGLLCFIKLMGLLTQSVFYLVCKSYHHESIGKSSLSDHLEVYHGDYVPLKTSNIQVEDLAGSV